MWPLTAAPMMAWIQNAALAGRLAMAIAIAPKPVLLPRAHHQERHTRLDITPDHPHYAAYAAARDARVVAPDPTGFSEGLRAGWLDVPVTEYRRIKAELDAADTTQ